MLELIINHIIAFIIALVAPLLAGWIIYEWYKLKERYNKALEQLNSDDESIRKTGIETLIEIAQNHVSSYSQKVSEVLCKQIVKETIIESQKDIYNSYHIQYLINLLLVKNVERLSIHYRKELSCANWQNATKYANFKDINFSGLNLGGCIFEGAIFENCKFNNVVNLEARSFAKATLIKCEFNNNTLGGCSFIEAKLQICDFTGVNLENCSFARAEIENCEFNNSLLSYFFMPSKLTNCKFIGSATILNGCQFYDKILDKGAVLDNCIFEESSLVSCNFNSATLINCKFLELSLFSYNFNNTIFEECEFIGGILGNCNFNQAILDKCKFGGILDKCTFNKDTKLEDCSFITPNNNKLHNCEFNEVILDTCSFTGAYGDYKFNKDTKLENCNIITYDNIEFNEAILMNCIIFVNSNNFIFNEVIFNFCSILYTQLYKEQVYPINKISFIDGKIENSNIFNDNIKEIVYDNVEINNTVIEFSLKYAEENDINILFKFYDSVKLDNVSFVNYTKAGIKNIEDIKKILKKNNVEYTNIFINQEDFEKNTQKYGYQYTYEEVTKNSNIYQLAFAVWLAHTIVEVREK
jgi:uncharacterized protein YjbI with pentapeptide repeats